MDKQHCYRARFSVFTFYVIVSRGFAASMFRIDRHPSANLALCDAQAILDLFETHTAALCGRVFTGEKPLSTRLADCGQVTSDPQLIGLFKEQAASSVLGYIGIEIRTRNGGVALQRFEDTRAIVFELQGAPFLPTVYILSPAESQRRVYRVPHMDFEDYTDATKTERRGILPQQVAYYSRISDRAFAMPFIRSAYKKLSTPVL